MKKAAFLLAAFLAAAWVLWDVVFDRGRPNLGRDKSAVAIQADPRFPGPKQVSLKVGELGHLLCGPELSSASTQRAMAAGLLDVQKGSGLLRLGLTDFAKSQLRGRPIHIDVPQCPYDLWLFPIATRKLKTVTGIAQIGVDLKRVEFRWEWVPLNKAAPTYLVELSKWEPKTELEITGEHPGVAIFQLYDDGWRLEKLDFGD